jgi:hypothetical protein
VTSSNKPNRLVALRDVVLNRMRVEVGCIHVHADARLPQVDNHQPDGQYLKILGLSNGWFRAKHRVGDIQHRSQAIHMPQVVVVANPDVPAGWFI